MKKVVVVGAGFAGLAAAYLLSEHFQVTLLDQKGIGAGASGASSGLLHAYPGEKGRRSWHATEAMAATKKLIKVAEDELGQPVANDNGILRLGECQGGEDVDPLGEQKFLIKSGMTVFPELYLQGLWQACQKHEVHFIRQKIASLTELEEYDQVVLTVGAGIRHFSEAKQLKINFVRGQVLMCTLDQPLERSISSKRYIALTPFPNLCHIGATYERDLISEEPCLETAMALLKPETEVLDCRAGIRVTNPAHYFPILGQLNSKTWVITALGSRGLLYHAYMAEMLTKKMIEN